MSIKLVEGNPTGRARRIVVASGVVFLVGAALLGIGASDAKSTDLEVGRQVDSAMGLLPDEQVLAAQNQLTKVNGRLNALADPRAWRRDFNDGNTEDLRMRFDGLRQIGEELSDQATNHEMDVLKLNGQRNSYAAKLRESYLLRDFKNVALRGLGTIMVVFGAIGGVIGLGRIAIAGDTEASKCKN